MQLPSADTPLYNHSLPLIEEWLISLGCRQDRKNLHCWHIDYPNWKALISLETEELTVSYLATGKESRDVKRAFKYSLTRGDVEDAVFSGP
jgi:hypothetical protein